VFTVDESPAPSAANGQGEGGEEEAAHFAAAAAAVSAAEEASMPTPAAASFPVHLTPEEHIFGGRGEMKEEDRNEIRAAIAKAEEAIASGGSRRPSRRSTPQGSRQPSPQGTPTQDLSPHRSPPKP